MTVRATMLRGVHTAWLRALRPSWDRFVAAADDPARAQRAIWERQRQDTADTAYARRHRLPTTFDAWRAEAPIVGWAELAPWITRAAAGEPAVLSRAPIRRFERTSGSGGPEKWIPTTDPLLRDFQAATNPWLYDLYASRPALMGTSAYWSISPVARAPELSPGGHVVGADDDTAYLSPVERALMRRMLAVPPEVARAPDLSAWRHATLAALLADGDLGLISVWSPSFLTRLMEALADALGSLTAGLPLARATAVREAVNHHGVGEALWPRLAVVSCWADGAAADQLPALRRFFPRVEIQPKGLLATEGVVTLPITGAPAPVFAVASHFLELAPVDGGPPVGVHEAEAGGRYVPLLTTGAGFVRYRLPDVIEIGPRWRGTPTARFRGRADRASDLVGEKLDAPLVEAALDAALEATGVRPKFLMLAPCAHEPPRYELFVETDASDAAIQALAAAVERALLGAFHYRYARDLGQLRPVAGVRVRDGARKYVDARVADGMRLGDVKPTRFETTRCWADRLR